MTEINIQYLGLIDQSSGCSYNYIYTGSNCFGLFGKIFPANNSSRGNPRMVTKSKDLLINLLCKFSGGRKDQCLSVLGRILQYLVQYWNYKSSRFTGSGLCRPDQVFLL